MLKLLLVGLFGAAGAVTRYLISASAVKWFGGGFPWGTLLVNVAGCFLLGMLYTAITGADGLREEWRQVLGVGFLGGLTTFSAFGYDTFRQLEQGLWHLACANVGANLVLGLTAVWLGVSAARLFTPGV